MQPLALYIHIPWCIKKCPYCDFNSHKLEGNLDDGNYLDALKQDLDCEKSCVEDERPLSSIFIGGGTPSLLSGLFYESLLDHVRDRFVFDNGIEITIEANPGAVDVARFREFHEAGINRLSIGVQSFLDTSLESLGRIHSGEEAVNSFVYARDAGFKNINLDLMYGLPGQLPAQATADLNKAISLDPDHISWYQLTIEKNTAFYRSPPPLPGEDEVDRMESQGQKLLENSGFVRYEISSYARKNLSSIHNINYWTFGDYIGVGAGAHGKITSESRVVRRWKRKMPASYIASKEKVSGQKQIQADELISEFMINALRLKSGFTPALLESRTGLHFENIYPAILKQIEKGLMEISHTRDNEIFYRATTRGYRYLNDLVTAFL